MAKYDLNDWDSFTFPIISLKDMDKEEIINNIETKLKEGDEFEDEELLELAVTPILENGRDAIIRQFHETADLMEIIPYHDEEIKNSVYGLVLMLSSMYFDELDPVRKKIQGDLMGKVDCVWEACQESYDDGWSVGKSESMEDVARSMLADDVPFEFISRHTGLPLEKLMEIKKAS